MKCEECDNEAAIAVEFFYHGDEHMMYSALCLPCADELAQPTYAEWQRPPVKLLPDVAFSQIDHMNELSEAAFRARYGRA